MIPLEITCVFEEGKRKKGKNYLIFPPIDFVGISPFLFAFQSEMLLGKFNKLRWIGGGGFRSERE